IVPDTHAAGIVNRVGDRCACPADAQFADSLALQRIGFGVELGKENRVHVEHIGMDWDVISSEVVVYEAAEARVEDKRFFEGCTDAKYHAADRLRSRGLLV